MTEPKVVHGMKLSQSRAFVVSALDDKAVPATRVFALLSALAAKVEELEELFKTTDGVRIAAMNEIKRLREALEKLANDYYLEPGLEDIVQDALKGPTDD